MRYEKGYVVDDNIRVEYCGTQLYNKCETTPEYDDSGNVVDHEILVTHDFVKLMGNLPISSRRGF